MTKARKYFNHTHYYSFSMLIQTSQSSHQRLLKRSFVLNMYIYICFIYTKGQEGVKIHCRYLINRQGSYARNNGLRLVNVAGGRDIDRAIKPRGKSVACTRACSRREPMPRRASAVIVYRYIEHPRLRPIERKPLLPPYP